MFGTSLESILKSPAVVCVTPTGNSVKNNSAAYRRFSTGVRTPLVFASRQARGHHTASATWSRVVSTQRRNSHSGRTSGDASHRRLPAGKFYGPLANVAPRGCHGSLGFSHVDHASLIARLSPNFVSRGNGTEHLNSWGLPTPEVFIRSHGNPIVKQIASVRPNVLFFPAHGEPKSMHLKKHPWPITNQGVRALLNHRRQ